MDNPLGRTTTLDVGLFDRGVSLLVEEEAVVAVAGGVTGGAGVGADIAGKTNIQHQ